MSLMAGGRHSEERSIAFWFSKKHHLIQPNFKESAVYCLEVCVLVSMVAFHCPKDYLTSFAEVKKVLQNECSSRIPKAS